MFKIKDKDPFLWATCRSSWAFNWLSPLSVFSQHTTHLSVPNLTTNNVTYVAPDLARNVFSNDLMAVTGDEMEALFEREKFAYMEKSKNLQDQLETLKSDIEDLKRDDKITELDKIHRWLKMLGILSH